MLKKMLLFSFIFLIISGTEAISSNDGETTLWKSGISIIPYPQSVVIQGDDFLLSGIVKIQIDKRASEEDVFTANELSRQLKDQWGINSEISHNIKEAGIILIRKKGQRELGEQGYQLEVSSQQLIVSANESSGLFYGVQSLLQVIQKKGNTTFIKGMMLKDWPDIPIRAIHYDTKHFQEKKEYVFNFIRTLANYKINMLIWEWEDKFAYKSHPEIGAPGAFTMEEMQEFTRFARKYHIQIVPLVQGLGHVSFILKHPENKHLREVESNNWGFCPYREGTYDLMSDLIKEAVEATPGSEYFHIGCDETYVLGEGMACSCMEKVKTNGRRSLLREYVNRTSEISKELKRQPMAWDGGFDPSDSEKPFAELYLPGGFNDSDDKAAMDAGYPLYVYDPNPGIEHLFLPYFYREDAKGNETISHLQDSYNSITKAAKSGLYKGMVSTSWNCSGVHNQIWMLRYITAAAFSWNGKSPGVDEFADSFFVNYYGTQSKNIKELFVLLNKASYYYMSAFERKVWHWGEIGKTHLPDLPRNDMEFDPFWNVEYAKMIKKSEEIIPQLDRALAICNENLGSGVKNAYDFELFEGLAQLFKHTAKTYLAMSELEKSVTLAASKHFDDNKTTYNELNHAAQIVEENIAERNQVFAQIVQTWEKHQLPKGMSSPEKKYVHGRDEQRNFANRRPDLTFMICDEEDLGLEEYLQKLKMYIQNYKITYLSE